jgi:hypothetical protein
MLLPRKPRCENLQSLERDGEDAADLDSRSRYVAQDPQLAVAALSLRAPRQHAVAHLWA